MKIKSNKIISVRGMTMAEMLTVVAIIVILAGVAFIGLFSYQRSLAQLERDKIAKEIFIAAQNHLTMSRGEGYMLSKKQMEETDPVIFGTEKKIDGKDVRCILINNGNIAAIDGSANGKWMYDIMLPFGAVDGTVIGNGSILIRYQKTTGTVIDVFYSTTSGSRFDYTLLSEETYDDLVDLAGDGKKKDRKNYNYGSVLGWYGGADLQDLKDPLDPPEITVENGAKLRVTIKDNNRLTSEKGSDPEALSNGTKMRLIVEGEQSGAKKYFAATWPLSQVGYGVEVGSIRNNIVYTAADLASGKKDEHAVYLDDITTEGMSFASQFVIKTNNSTAEETPAIKFIPGENLIIKAVVFNKDHLANVAYSNEVVTNSLFAKADGTQKTTEGVMIPDTAYISNIRHLENLDDRVSSLDSNDISEVNGGKVNFSTAKQTDNLIWKDSDDATKDFASEISPGTDKSPDIYYSNTNTNGVYLPVNPLVAAQSTKSFKYDGQMHSISAVTAKGVGAEGETYGGMFGNLSTYIPCEIGNLELVNFKISDAKYAGSLAGNMHSASVKNVIARNTREYEREYPNVQTPNKIDLSLPAAADIIGTGSVGGLIGTASDVHVSNSAAALIVRGTGSASAGGLVGSFASEKVAIDGNPEDTGTITGCYSGGHTERGEYYKHKADGTREKDSTTGEDVAIYNVQSESGPAGGLVGIMSDGLISKSYSTCSASGSTSGGFIGTAVNGPAVTDCYATGLIKVTATKKEDYEKIDPFVGNGSNKLDSSSYGDKYYSIVNEFKDDKGEVLYLEPQLEDKNRIAAIDKDTESYDGFMTEADKTAKWADAVSYDHYDSGAKSANRYVYSLEAWYGNKYNLKTVGQLGAELSPTPETSKYYVSTHYGDWPAPEIFFINTPNS